MVIVGICIVLGWLCYDSIFSGIALLPVGAIVFMEYSNTKLQRQRGRRQEELKEMFYCLVGNLRVGYSMENAWNNATVQMDKLYGHTYLVKEMQRVIQKIEMNIPIEQALMEFGDQIDLEEARQFCEIFFIARKSGGNLVKQLTKTAEALSGRLAIEQEIQSTLAGKRLEQRIMCMMPLFMLAFLRITNAAYVEGLYHNVVGVVLVTAGLIMMIGAYYWGKSILNISV